MKPMSDQETASTLFDEVQRLRDEALRSERHRNDLMDKVVSLRTERGAARRQVEIAEHHIAGLIVALRAAEAGASGGAALKTTADMLRWIAERWNQQAGETGAPTQACILERAAMLDSATGIMRLSISSDSDGSKDEEAEDLFQSERISEAQRVYDDLTKDLDPSEPDYEEHVFDAMKAAIARADHIVATGRVR